MQDSSSDAWDDMKTGFAEAYDSLAESWKSAEDEMKDEM
jgi:hypothetical protein